MSLQCGCSRPRQKIVALLRRFQHYALDFPSWPWQRFVFLIYIFLEFCITFQTEVSVTVDIEFYDPVRSLLFILLYLKPQRIPTNASRSFSPVCSRLLRADLVAGSRDAQRTFFLGTKKKSLHELTLPKVLLDSRWPGMTHAGGKKLG